MPKYVDGFLLPVKRKNIAAYKKMAALGARLWKKHGALEYFECIGDDLNPKWAAVKFPKVAKVKPGETVVFSFIVFKSRAHRDQVNKKVMAEMDKQAMKYKDMGMPFDMKRMAYGGFKVLIEA